MLSFAISPAPFASAAIDAWIVGIVGGLASSALWLVMLFLVKPRVGIWLVRGEAIKEGYVGFAMENLGLARVTNVKVCLWIVHLEDDIPSHTELRLRRSELLELEGMWHESRRRKWELKEYTGDSYFLFLLADSTMSAHGLNKHDRYVVQVDCMHPFTNFGRLHSFRFAKRDDLQRISDLQLVSNAPRWLYKGRRLLPIAIARLSERFPPQLRSEKVRRRKQRAKARESSAIPYGV